MGKDYNPMVFTMKQLSESSLTCQPDKTWHPAKPIGWLGMKFWNRVRAAWVVLKNDGIVVRWYK
jgi:hypothetical protein